MNKQAILYSENFSLDHTQIINLNFMHPKSSAIVPKVSFSGYWNEKGIGGRFDVEDNSILAECTEDMSSIWNDSCVEIFLKPQNMVGHFGFEFNSIGKLYACYIKNETLIDGKFKESFPCTIDDCSLVKRNSLFKKKIFPERIEKTNWWVDFFIPIILLQKYFGEFSFHTNSKLRANFYKCGDKLQNPHWLSWNKIDELNFHKEQCFGEITLI